MDTDTVRRTLTAVLAAAIASAPGTAAVADAATPPATSPNLSAALGYLTTTPTPTGTGGTSLSDQGYYQSAPSYADFGLTIDGAFALAAAHQDSAALAKVVTFIANGHDGSGETIRTWTATTPGDEVAGKYPYVASGAVGKEALLAEMVGDNPRAFGGQNLISMLNHEVCAATTSSYPMCAGAGNYDNADSTFDQALGIIAQVRAGVTSVARRPIAFLESQQHPTGAWSQIIPAGSDSDVDSTAMAAMALAIVHNQTAGTAVTRAVSWIAAQQESGGGFPGASGDSTNSTALAIMAMHLEGGQYATQISTALGFLASEQNSDGGFDIAAGDTGSDVRASTQVVSGIVGTSFATVSDPLGS